MIWFEQKTDSELSQAIRRDLRLYRREKGKGGHKFLFKDLLAICSDTDDSDRAEHAIVTHHQDPAWQHYWRHPERGWMQQKAYATRDEAAAAVEVFTPPKIHFKTAVRDPETGESKPSETATYVFAGVDGGPKTMRVKVSSPWVEKQMAEVFARLGYETDRKTVSS